MDVEALKLQIVVFKLCLSRKAACLTIRCLLVCLLIILLFPLSRKMLVHDVC